MLGDLLQQVDVARDEVGLGDDAEAQAAVFGEDLQQAARNTDAALDGLIRIGGRTNDDLVLRIDLLQLLFEQPGSILLQVDLALKGQRPALLRNVMRAGRRRAYGRGLQELCLLYTSRCV